MKSRATPGVHREAASKPVGIVIADDHVFMRELMSATLARQCSRYKVLAEVGSAADALAACQSLSPDLLILDIYLPDRSGIEAVADLKQAAPTTRILLCTAFGSEDYFLDSVRSGADGFVEKTNTWNEFMDAVDCVCKGDRYFRSTCSPATAGAARGEPPGKGALSPREREVLRFIAGGSTSKEIAAKLFLSVQTVETHRSNLMSKLGVHNVAGLVLSAVRSGLLNWPHRVHQFIGAAMLSYLLPVAGA